MMRTYIITWHNGRTGRVQADSYRDAHRQAHNKTNWRSFGAVFCIGLFINPQERAEQRQRAIATYKQLMGGTA